ncbi:MAG: right-handed parallel beta-helix repeat-containing protein [Pirellulales bacterium]|nr:right-handed parallel beta-helix repeat-containing protein [Pirellulales bacterium]
MGCRIGMLLVGVVVSGSGLPVVADGAPPEVIYVAPSGNDAWSGRLADANGERTDGPLASLAAARDAIRKRKEAGPLAAPVEVRLRGGVYRPQEMLVLEPRDSGTEQCPVSYLAHPEETPVLSGGVPITGFKPWRGEIVSAELPASLPEGAYFRSLFVDGERMIRARCPNYVPEDPYRKGFLYIRPDCFGEAVGAMHNRGDWLEWEYETPANGEYRVWALYAHGMKKLGREDMAGQTSLAVDGGPKVALESLPDTDGWTNYRWSEAARLTLAAGKHTLRWSNDKGGGYNLDALVLTDDPEWRPAGWKRPPATAGKHLVTIQCEEYKACQGLQIVKCGGLSASSKTEFPFLVGTAKASWAQEPDAEVHVWPSSPHSCRAFNEIVKLDRVDPAEAIIAVSGKEAAVEVCSGDRYFVENILEELDSPGEWYLDRAGRTLYLWPKSPLTETSQVIAPRLTRLVEFRGAREQPVEFVRLAGLTIEETDYTPDDGFVAYGRNLDGVITLRHTAHVSVEDCRLRNIGKAGLHSDGDRENRFVGNEISHGAEGGIYLMNSAGGTVISDNHIHHLGWVYKHVAGISTGTQVHGATIAHNHVHDTTRWGISVAHTDSTRNIVESNHLHDLNTETYDTGGLEVTQQSRDHRSGSIFRYNLIHDTGGYSSMMGRDMWNSWGIYLDSFAGGFTVYGNVVYGAYDGGLMVQGGKDNRIYNNIFVENGPHRQLLIANFSDNSRGTQFHHNIVSYTAPEAVAIYCGRQVPQSIARWDENLYWHAGQEVRVFSPGDEPYGQWTRALDFWKGLGFDQESLVADPQFIDPGRHDYRLKPTSPALGLGFEPIDLSGVGPRRGAGR